jgi:hypothetical protein
MAQDDRRSYSSADVCRAVGLPRPTFDAWLLRQYLPLPEGPGTGRARTYSLLDAVRIAAAYELTRIGISVGFAGRAIGNISDSSLDPPDGHRTALVLASPPSPRDGGDRKGPTVVVCPFKGMADIEFRLRHNFVGGPPVGFTMIDVTAIADRTQAELEDPEREHPMATWLDESPGTAKPKPRRGSVRMR